MNVRELRRPDLQALLALYRHLDPADPVFIAICGSGIGISMACNRNPKVRAGLCTDSTMARLTRLHNDANALCLGERLIGTEVALDILQTFLETPFEGGHHQGRIDKLSKL